MAADKASPERQHGVFVVENLRVPGNAPSPQHYQIKRNAYDLVWGFEFPGTEEKVTCEVYLNADFVMRLESSGGEFNTIDLRDYNRVMPIGAYRYHVAWLKITSSYNGVVMATYGHVGALLHNLLDQRPSKNAARVQIPHLATVSTPLEVLAAFEKRNQGILVFDAPRYTEACGWVLDVAACEKTDVSSDHLETATTIPADGGEN